MKAVELRSIADDANSQDGFKFAEAALPDLYEALLRAAKLGRYEVDMVEGDPKFKDFFGNNAKSRSARRALFAILEAEGFTVREEDDILFDYIIISFREE